jgi:hypothetical protein
VIRQCWYNARQESRIIALRDGAEGCQPHIGTLVAAGLQQSAAAARIRVPRQSSCRRCAHGRGVNALQDSDCGVTESDKRNESNAFFKTRRSAF